MTKIALLLFDYGFDCWKVTNLISQSLWLEGGGRRRSRCKWMLAWKVQQFFSKLISGLFFFQCTFDAVEAFTFTAVRKKEKKLGSNSILLYVSWQNQKESFALSWYFFIPKSFHLLRTLHAWGKLNECFIHPCYYDVIGYTFWPRPIGLCSQGTSKVAWKKKLFFRFLSTHTHTEQSQSVLCVCGLTLSCVALVLDWATVVFDQTRWGDQRDVKLCNAIWNFLQHYQTWDEVAVTRCIVGY